MRVPFLNERCLRTEWRRAWAEAGPPTGEEAPAVLAREVVGGLSGHWQWQGDRRVTEL